MLGGIGRVAEVDESKLFHAKYNRGDMLGRQYDWVFGMLERGTNKVRFFHVADRTANCKILLFILPSYHDG